MRLLIFTQKVDSSDTVLGFFCGWIREFAKNYESVTVICLEKGEYTLPDNVTVYSLGKEVSNGHLQYIINLYRYLLLIRGTYDQVFVHMNQEYVLLAGLYWRLSRKPVYLWRNHPYGNIGTWIAVCLSTKAFCTSKQSFTARFSKTVVMPAGIDTKKFVHIPSVLRNKNSVCMVGRIAPVKGIGLALEALNNLIESGTQVSLTVIGTPLPKDIRYYKALKEYAEIHSLSSYVQFEEAVLPDTLPHIYSSYEICLNLTEDGSFDKTIVEAAACGAIPVVSNAHLRGLLPDSCITERTAESIAESIAHVLSGPVRVETARLLKSFVESQSLDGLMQELKNQMHV